MYVYSIASHANTWYFFCASGINFTGKIIELIEHKKLDEVLINFKGDPLLFFNNLYDILFTNFNSYWLKKGIKSFMDFNSNLDEFMKLESHKFLNNDLLLKHNLYY